MASGNRILSAILLAGSVITPALTTGCAEHHYYRAYDPYYGDYHRWGPNEEVYYRQWISERHYEYREYSKLDKDRQREYWDWRHKHHDRDSR